MQMFVSRGSRRVNEIGPVVTVENGTTKMNRQVGSASWIAHEFEMGDGTILQGKSTLRERIACVERFWEDKKKPADTLKASAGW